MSMELDAALNYSPVSVSHPSYRMSNVIPLTGQSYTLNASSTSEMQIEISQKVINLSRSHLDFRMDVAASTGTLNTNLFTLGASMIDSIDLYSREGVHLAVVPNADMFTRAVLPLTEKYENYIAYDSSNGAATTALAETTGDRGFNFGPSGTIAVATAVPSLAKNGTRILASTAAGIADRSYNEMSYFKQSADDTIASCNFSIPLSKIAPHTILSQDKDLYFGQALILKVNWNSSNNIGFTNAGATKTTLATQLYIASAVTIANCRLRLAVESNPAIVETLVNRVNSSGMSLTIPYVYVYQQAVATGSVASTQTQRFNRAHGERLLNVYNCMFQGSGSTTTASVRPDLSNLVQVKVSQYMPSLNSSNLSEFVIDETKGDGWSTHEDLLKGSCIQSKNIYDHNRVVVSSWRQGRSCNWVDVGDGVIDGLSLENEQTYTMDNQLIANLATGYRSFQFVVTQRSINIQKGSISLS